MATDYKFEGWLAKAPDSIEGKMEWGALPEVKTWTEDDVDIQITHCGVCGSDLHTMSAGWGEVEYPCCVGHEIVGKAVRVGKNVGDRVKVGDRVGVGAQGRSCLQSDCPHCSVGRTPYCTRERINTYASKYPEGGMSYGGYADYNRTHNRFVFKIPDALPSELAAPLLCGGVTMYSPLRQTGCGPGKTVGIIGVGGLGHMGVMLAKALGADKVVGISRRANKKEEALKIGADAYIATADDKDWAKVNSNTLDIIISTVSSAKMPMTEYLSLLKTGGTLIQVGAPDGGELPPINAFTLILNNLKVGGSLIGSPTEIEEMLQLAADKQIKPWVELRPMSEANQTVRDMHAEKARYRYVLVNEKHL